MSDSASHPRMATPADAGKVAHHRALMFHEMGVLTIERMADFEANARSIIERALADAVYRHWFIEEPAGNVIAGGGVQLRPLLPRPDTEHPLEAIILNVFVDVPHRRRGHARRIMQAILGWCRGQNIERIVLHPSPEGKPLYESIGFAPTGELRYRGAPVDRS